MLLCVAYSLGAPLVREESLSPCKTPETPSGFVTNMNMEESWKCGFILDFQHAAFQNQKHFKDWRLQDWLICYFTPLESAIIWKRSSCIVKKKKSSDQLKQFTLLLMISDCCNLLLNKWLQSVIIRRVRRGNVTRVLGRWSLGFGSRFSPQSAGVGTARGVWPREHPGSTPRQRLQLQSLPPPPCIGFEKLFSWGFPDYFSYK